MKNVFLCLLCLCFAIPALADYDARMNVIQDPVIGPIFQNRVTCAMAEYAKVVRIEPDTVLNHSERDALAVRVLRFQAPVNSFYILIVNDTNVSALIDAGTLGAITDEMLFIACRDNWDFIAVDAE